MKYRNARVLWQDNLLERAFDHQSVAFKSKSVAFKSKSVAFKSKSVCLQITICGLQNQNLCPSNQNLCLSNQNLCPSNQYLWPSNQNLSLSNQNLCPSNQNMWPSNQNCALQIKICALQTKICALQTKICALQHGNTTTTSTSKTDAWLIKDISAQENLSNRGTPLSFHRFEPITETIFNAHKEKMLPLLFSSSSITYISNLPFTIFNLLIYSCHLVYNYSNVLFIHLSHVEGHRLVFERSFK